MKIRSENAYKILLARPETETVLVNADVLFLLNIDFLAQCRLIASPQQKFPSFFFPNAPNPGGDTIATGGGTII